MGKYLTHSRKLQANDAPFTWRYNSQQQIHTGFAQGGGNGIEPQQVTTSWRTTPEASIAESDNDFVPSNRAEYAAMLRDSRADYRRERDGTDTGHTFDTTKEEIYLSHLSSAHVNPLSYHPMHGYQIGDGQTYTGPLWPNRVFLSGPIGFIQLPTPNLTELGTEAINRTLPTKSATSLANTLGELKREGLPDLPGLELQRQHTLRAIDKSAGSEYLNVEFGWKPLIGDIQKTHKAVTRSKQILAQYYRDSGRVVRRKYTFPEKVEVVKYADRPGALGNPITYLTDDSHFFQLFGNANGVLSQQTRVETHTYFSGAYSYYLDEEGKSLIKKIGRFERDFNRVFGTRVTPEVLWNLAPWSWFGDWNANIGQIISNATHLGSDGLVLRYGYLMCRTYTENTYTLSGVTRKDGSTMAPISVSLRRTRKQRVRANPYGFALNTDAYSGRQWAILTALGMTKSPQRLMGD